MGSQPGTEQRPWPLETGLGTGGCTGGPAGVGQAAEGISLLGPVSVAGGPWSGERTGGAQDGGLRKVKFGVTLMGLGTGA